MTIGAIVLAAGAGRRMRAVKPLVAISGKPMLAHVLDSVATAGLPALVVTGAHADAVGVIAGSVQRVHAADHALGMAHSLHAGLHAAPAAWTGALVVLADMPMVRADTYRMLADALASGAPAVVPVHAGQRGNPVGFARGCFAALMALEGDRGARGILDTLGPAELPVNDPGVLRDFDRPEDLPV